jgi:hypothetical protein
MAVAPNSTCTVGGVRRTSFTRRRRVRALGRSRERRNRRARFFLVLWLRLAERLAIASGHEARALRAHPHRARDSRDGHEHGRLRELGRVAHRCSRTALGENVDVAVQYQNRSELSTLPSPSTTAFRIHGPESVARRRQPSTRGASLLSRRACCHTFVHGQNF